MKKKIVFKDLRRPLAKKFKVWFFYGLKPEMSRTYISSRPFFGVEFLPSSSPPPPTHCRSRLSPPSGSPKVHRTTRAPASLTPFLLPPKRAPEAMQKSYGIDPLHCPPRPRQQKNHYFSKD